MRWVEITKDINQTTRFLVVMLVCLANSSTLADTFIVTSKASAGPGTLRQAILDSNATLLPTPNTITFNLPTTDVLPFYISVSSALPVITRPVEILGDTQPGSASFPDHPVIDIVGFSVAGAAGLVLNTTNCTIRRLAISAFDNEGILIQGGGNHFIVGNHVGINTNGNVYGGGNGVGISIVGSCFNVIGGTAPQDRNVISQNDGNGIYVENSSSSNFVIGNFVGLDMLGITARGNGNNGILVEGDYNVIGGNVPGAGNVVSASLGNPYGSAGVNIDGSWGDRATGNRVQGNLIGTDVTGAIAIGNQNGIRLESSQQSLIGGATALDRNVISGNFNNGILTAIYPLAAIGARDTIIAGNFIGTDKLGTSPLPNGRGIYSYVLPNSNILIGGTNGPGEANVIAYNRYGGVGVLDGTVTTILGNSIFLNGGTNRVLGIDLGMDDVTPNDSGDSDTGANNLQNFPKLTRATSDGHTIRIDGSLGSEPSLRYLMQFFRNDTCDPTGYGEGERFIGQKFVTTDASGNVSFTATFPLTLYGDIITATATSPEGNTSEFSHCLPLVSAPRVMVTRIGGYAVISWPADSGSDWILEQSPLAAPPVWSDVATKAKLTGNDYAVSIPMDGAGYLYRLRGIEQ